MNGPEVPFLNVRHHRNPGDGCFWLPLVGGKPLYSLRHSYVDAIKGHQYRAFYKTIRLTQVMRQQGEDDISIKFRLVLSELRVSQMSKESWEFLCTRVANQLS
ncbi:hypothetical protein V8E54_007620 [Elaphomyces granulatus]